MDWPAERILVCKYYRIGKTGTENCDAVKIFYSLPLDFSLSNKFTTFARG